MENLSIKTIPVTIRVLEVGGKRLTLSVFKQIPHGWPPFGKSEEFDKSFLGWVSYGDIGYGYILFSKNGILSKWHIDGYSADFEEAKKCDLWHYANSSNQIYISV